VLNIYTLLSGKAPKAHINSTLGGLFNYYTPVEYINSRSVCPVNTSIVAIENPDNFRLPEEKLSLETLGQG
jgi:hypothetical protein